MHEVWIQCLQWFYLILLFILCRDEIDQELQGTGIPEAVKRDKNIYAEYESSAYNNYLFDSFIHIM